MALSRIVAIGNGVTKTFAVNFALGYIRQSDVTARVGNEVDGLGQPVYRTITFDSPTLMTISGAAPGNGVQVVFDRTVLRTQLLVDYEDGDIINDDNLNRSQLQAIMLVHEVLDGKFGAFNSDLDFGGFRLKSVGDPQHPADAVNLRTLDLQIGTGQANANAAALSASQALGFRNAAEGFAGTASAQAGISTTQAGIATTKAGEAAGSATYAGEQANYAFQWAVKIDGPVAGIPGQFSSRAWSITSSEWAEKSTAVVTGQYSAKTWATKLGSTVDGTLYSAQYYSMQAAGYRDTTLTYRNDAEGFKNTAQALKNDVDTQKGLVDTAKAAVDTAKGQVDTAKTAVDTQKGLVDTAKASVDSSLLAIRALYQGALASDPALDLGGQALTNKAYYYNIGTAKFRFYNGTTWQDNPVTAVSALQEVGQCQLRFLSGNVLGLYPKNGDKLLISGVPRAVPAGGVSFTNGSLAANTLYFAYATWSGSAIVALWSTTTPVLDTSLGYMVRTGQTNATFVGMAYTTASATFIDNPSYRYTRSYFNEPGVALYMYDSNVTPNSGTTPNEILTALRLSFLAWPGERIVGSSTCSVAHSVSGAVIRYGIGFNTAAHTSGISLMQPPAANIYNPITASFYDEVGTGYQLNTMIPTVSQNSGTGQYAHVNQSYQTTRRV